MGRNWDPTEDEILKQMVAQHGKQWALIAQQLPQRTPTQVAARWEKCLDPNITKGPFTAEEDQMIIEFVNQNGPRSWPKMTQILPHRSPKQCRERWFNHLSPNVVKTPWSQEEDTAIFEQHQKIGPKWSQIAKILKGRTDNAIKNRWNSSIKKRIQTDSQGHLFILPDSSHRQYKRKQITGVLTDSFPSQNEERENDHPHPIITKGKPPPLLVPPPNFKNDPEPSLGPFTDGIAPPPTISPTTPFTPFNLNTPNYQPIDSGFFSPTSPIPGFQTTGFSLTSPTGTQTTPFLFSPTKPSSDSPTTLPSSLSRDKLQ